MKLNLKKINYHKWIPSRFSSFQAKLLIAFLVATLLPLTLVALVSYHVSYNLARDRITNSALMSDEQLIFQLNSRLNQTENVADTIQYQMYAFEHSSPDQVGTMQALTSMRSNISLYKSTFDFFHIYVFLILRYYNASLLTINPVCLFSSHAKIHYYQNHSLSSLYFSLYLL